MAFHFQVSLVPTSQNDVGGARGTGGGMIGESTTNGGDGGGQLRRSLRRLLTRLHFIQNGGDKISGDWHLAVLFAWLSTLLCGWLYGYYGQLPGRDEQDATPAVYALWWAVSRFLALGGHKGYIDMDDLGISGGAAGGGSCSVRSTVGSLLSLGAPPSTPPANSGGGSFCDGGPLCRTGTRTPARHEAKGTTPATAARRGSGPTGSGTAHWTRLGCSDWRPHRHL